MLAPLVPHFEQIGETHKLIVPERHYDRPFRDISANQHRLQSRIHVLMLCRDGIKAYTWCVLSAEASTESVFPSNLLQSLRKDVLSLDFE